MRLSSSTILDAITQYSTVGIIAVDLQGKVIYLNKAYENILGVPAKDAIGKLVAELMPATRLHLAARSPHFKKGLSESYREGGFLKQLIPLYIHGNLIGVMEQCFLYDSNQLDIYEGSRDKNGGADSSCLMNLAALKKSERKYRLLFEQVYDGIFLMERVKNEALGYIREVNEVVCRQLGYTRKELIGMSLKEIDPALTSEECAKYDEQIKLTGIMTLERMHLTKNGILLPVELRSGTIELDGAEYVLSIARDLTEQKKAEKLRRSAFKRMKRNHLLNDLLKTDNPPEERIHEIIEVVGGGLSGVLFCFLVMVEQWKGRAQEHRSDDSEESFLLHDKIMDVLDSNERWTTWRGPDGVAVLYAGTPSPDRTEKLYQEELARQIVNAIENGIPEITVVIGIADTVCSLTRLREGYKQSYLAAFAGVRAWPERKVYHYLDMGVFQVLPLAGDPAVVQSYIDRNLGKLIRYDAEKGTDLVATLEALLEYSSLTIAAEKLYIHIKTMEFRRKKIESLLGVSLKNFETKMVLATALKLLRFTISDRLPVH